MFIYMPLSDRLILLYLRENVVPDKSIKMEVIADAIGVHKLTVLRSIKRLERDGSIRKFGGGRGRAGGYMYEVCV